MTKDANKGEKRTGIENLYRGWNGKKGGRRMGKGRFQKGQSRGNG